MPKTHITLTASEQRQLYSDAHQAGMSASNYIRNQLCLLVLVDGSQRTIGDAQWYHRAKRLGYTRDELQFRAEHNGVSFREACEAVA